MGDADKPRPSTDSGPSVWFGFKRVPEEQKKLLVRRHFDSIAGRYDFMNTLLSVGMHHLWKRAAIKAAGIEPGNRVLDVCGGTGDLALRAAPVAGAAGLVILLDVNRAMLQMAMPKIGRGSSGEHIVCLQGDAEALPAADGTFDAATVGFGVRNVTHPDRAFREMCRVLKPGGRFVCLEFSKPANPIFRALYDAYSFTLMPLAGWLLTGSWRAYTYLPESIRKWPAPAELAATLEAVGLREVAWKRLTNGVAVIHSGIKA